MLGVGRHSTVCLACSFAILPFLSFYKSVDNTNVTMYHHLISQAGWNSCNLSIYLSWFLDTVGVHMFHLVFTISSLCLYQCCTVRGTRIIRYAYRTRIYVLSNFRAVLYDLGFQYFNVL